MTFIFPAHNVKLQQIIAAITMVTFFEFLAMFLLPRPRLHAWPSRDFNFGLDAQSYEARIEIKETNLSIDIHGINKEKEICDRMCYVSISISKSLIVFFFVKFEPPSTYDAKIVNVL